MEINDKLSGPVNIAASQVAYGELGLNGSLGYEGRRVNVNGRTVNESWISAHAPSTVEIELETNAEVYGAINASGSPYQPVTAFIDDEQIGEIAHAHAKTDTKIIKRGNHRLEFQTTDNRAAHTVWSVRPIRDPVIEILTNALCPRNCAGCNQRDFMKANPDYEYTAEDAAALVGSLKKSDKYIRVCFTGGEPLLWKQMDDVMAILRTTNRVTGNWVVTSDPTEESIQRLKNLFDKVCLSKRNDTDAFIDSKPAWLHGVTVWDQREHAIPNSVPAVAAVECCCKEQGIRAALIGQTVYPCVLAESLSISGSWNDCPRLSLDSYFQNDGFLNKIGTYDVCRTCVNNLCYRREAKKALT